MQGSYLPGTLFHMQNTSFFHKTVGIFWYDVGFDATLVWNLLIHDFFPFGHGYGVDFVVKQVNIPADATPLPRSTIQQEAQLDNLRTVCQNFKPNSFFFSMPKWYTVKNQLFPFIINIYYIEIHVDDKSQHTWVKIWEDWSAAD